MEDYDTKLSSWAKNISPSPTLAITAKANALRAAGNDICSFGAGEPDFDTPDFIKEACINALQSGATKYAPVAGINELRSALAQKFSSENKIPNVIPDQVVVSPGGKFSCYLALLATCNEGDEVIVPVPYWVSYPEIVKLTAATPIFLQADKSANFKISAAQFENAITAKTKLLILNSPSNPTGAVYTRKELEDIVEVALRNNILILSDEIYEYLVYDDAKHYSPASFDNKAASIVITAGGFSKSFSMTGWRLGTVVAPLEIAKAISKLQSQTTSNATTFAQYGALAALENPELAKNTIVEWRNTFNKRRLKMWEILNTIKGIECMRSEGAFYLFPSIEQTGLDSSTFATRLLEEEKVAVVPGVAFGDDSCIRLSYATSDDVIDNGLKRIASFCNKILK